MPDNSIYISVDGKKFTGWTDVKISKSLETLTSSFELTATDKHLPDRNQDWLLRPQDECIISVGTEVLLTGYIDKLIPSVSKDSHTIKIIGRDKTSDIVDCSYTESKSSFSKVTMYTLIQKLVEPFGLTVKKDSSVSDTEKFQFTVNKNDSIFNNLNKKANDLGILLITNSSGEIVLTNSGDATIDDVLEYGDNVESATVTYDYTNRFSEYIVNAQSLYKQSKGNWGTNIKITATSEDEGIKRYRPKLIKPNSPLSRTLAQKRANWEALIRSAKSQLINVTIPGFRTRGGVLWDLNKLVDVLIPPLYINPTVALLITAVEFSLSSSGTFTKMTLKRPDAYTSEPGRKISKVSNSLGWDRLG